MPRTGRDGELCYPSHFIVKTGGLTEAKIIMQGERGKKTWCSSDLYIAEHLKKKNNS